MLSLRLLRISRMTPKSMAILRRALGNATPWTSKWSHRRWTSPRTNQISPESKAQLDLHPSTHSAYHIFSTLPALALPPLVFMAEPHLNRPPARRIHFTRLGLAPPPRRWIADMGEEILPMYRTFRDPYTFSTKHPFRCHHPEKTVWRFCATESINDFHGWFQSL